MLSISPASIADIPLIRKLAYAVWPTAYGAILSTGQIEYMLQLLYSEEALTVQMKKGQEFYIAYLDAEPVGFVAFGFYNSTTYKLHKIYVSPQLQGQGAGRQLLQFVIDKAKEKKAVSLILNVNRQNPAIAFYKKTGFEIAGEVDIDIDNGYWMNDYIMKLTLK